MLNWSFDGDDGVWLLTPWLFPVGEKQPTILKWRILTTTGDLERVSAVALPKLPISISNTDLKVASDTKFCPGLGEEDVYE